MQPLLCVCCVSFFFSWTNDGQYLALGLFNGFISIRNKVHAVKKDCSYLVVVNLQIYVGTSSLRRANNVPKLLGVDYVAKNRALTLMLKALPLLYFWSIIIVVERANDDLC